MEDIQRSLTRVKPVQGTPLGIGEAISPNVCDDILCDKVCRNIIKSKNASNYCSIG